MPIKEYLPRARFCTQQSVCFIFSIIQPPRLGLFNLSWTDKKMEFQMYIH